MNIQVQGVRKTRGGIEVTLDHAPDSPEFARALRILHLFPSNPSPLVYEGSSVYLRGPLANFTGIDTAVKCRTLLGIYANVPFGIQDTATEVFAYGVPERLVANYEQAAAARRAGYTLGADIRFLMSLPMLPDDIARLGQIIPGTVYQLPNPCMFGVGLRFEGDRATGDPWYVAGELIFKVRGALPKA